MTLWHPRSCPRSEQLCETEPYVVPKALLPHAALVNASVAQLRDAAQRMQLHTRLVAKSCAE